MKEVRLSGSLAWRSKPVWARFGETVKPDTAGKVFTLVQLLSHTWIPAWSTLTAPNWTKLMIYKRGEDEVWL